MPQNGLFQQSAHIGCASRSDAAAIARTVGCRTTSVIVSSRTSPSTKIGSPNASTRRASSPGNTRPSASYATSLVPAKHGDRISPVAGLGRSVEPRPDGDLVRDQPLCRLFGHAAQVADERDAERLARGALVGRAREFDEMPDAVDVEQGLAGVPLELKGDRRRRALERDLDDLLGRLTVQVRARVRCRRRGLTPVAAPGHRDDVQLRPARDVLDTPREPGRERVEIEALAEKAPGLQLREARVAIPDLPRQQLRELRLAQKDPVAAVRGDQDLPSDPAPAEESQLVRRERRRRRHHGGGGHYSSSGAGARRMRTIVSCKARLQNEFSIVWRSPPVTASMTAITASPDRPRAMSAYSAYAAAAASTASGV